MVMSWWQWLFSVVLAAALIGWAARRERKYDDGLELRWYVEASLIGVPWCIGAVLVLAKVGALVLAGWRAM
jgi:hypothetical protein